MRCAPRKSHQLNGVLAVHRAAGAWRMILPLYDLELLPDKTRLGSLAEGGDRCATANALVIREEHVRMLARMGVGEGGGGGGVAGEPDSRWPFQEDLEGGNERCGKLRLVKAVRGEQQIERAEVRRRARVAPFEGRSRAERLHTWPIVLHTLVEEWKHLRAPRLLRDRLDTCERAGHE